MRDASFMDILCSVRNCLRSENLCASWATAISSRVMAEVIELTHTQADTNAIIDVRIRYRNSGIVWGWIPDSPTKFANCHL
mmetsp:Transcript_72902/g.133267  ORF Transcript_72902/g.133267 Transcript_72902/m.133267 type:complete len:81 (+) Transcript_72902:466-708(+)